MNPALPPGLRVYRAFLRLYPAEFRARFADEMVQLLADQLRDARRAGAAGGLARTWLRTAGDLVSTSISERTRRDRIVAHSLAEPPSPITRVLAVAGLVGGGLLVAAFLPFVPWGTLDVFNLRLVGFNLGAVAIAIAMARRLSPDAPRLALAGAIPAIVANAWYLVMVLRLVALPGEPGPGDYGFWFDVAATAMWLGDAWFGAVVAWIGGGTRWLGVAMAVGSVFAWSGLSRLGLVSGDIAWLVGPLALAGVAVNGLGWMSFGAVLLRGNRRGSGVRPA